MNKEQLEQLKTLLMILQSYTTLTYPFDFVVLPALAILIGTVNRMLKEFE